MAVFVCVWCEYRQRFCVCVVRLRAPDVTGRVELHSFGCVAHRQRRVGSCGVGVRGAIQVRENLVFGGTPFVGWVTYLAWILSLIYGGRVNGFVIYILTTHFLPRVQ